MKILLADDHTLFRDGIASLLDATDIEVIGQADDGLAAIDMARKLRPELILMDLNMPRCNGLEATRRIKAEMPEISIVMLTVSDDDDDLFEAIKAGASGYLLKDLKAEQFLSLLDDVRRGETAVCQSLASRMLAEFACRAGGSERVGIGLTDREIDVLRLVSTGALNKEIAIQLSITENTVKYYMRNIMGKLHLKNRAQVAAYATSKGFKPNAPSAQR